MLVDFSYAFKDMEGEILEEPYKEGKRQVTLRRIACSALIASYDDERNLDGEEKFKRGALGEKIALSTEPLELSAEEIAMVKKLIGKGFSPLIVYQAHKVLEGKLDAANTT